MGTGTHQRTKYRYRTISTGIVRGASKIKLKKVNKKRTVTVRRVIIFLNISRHPLLICLQCCLHQYKTLKAVATATAVMVLLTPAKNLKKVFLGFLVVSPLFNHYCSARDWDGKDYLRIIPRVVLVEDPRLLKGPL